MADDVPKLRSVQGGRPAGEPRAGRRRSLDQSEQLTCTNCLTTRSVETSRFRKVVLAPRRRPDGKIEGGTQAWVCDYCGQQV